MRKYFNFEDIYNKGHYSAESDYSMKYREDFIVLCDKFNTLRFDSKQSMIAVSDAFNNILSILFNSDNQVDVNKMIELLNKYLKEITIISAVNSKDTYDYKTGITHTISEDTRIGGRCFHNSDGTYSVVALGYSAYTELDATSIHHINHELWHLFSNIAPHLYYDDTDLTRDTGETLEIVSDCGIDIIDKHSGKNMPKKEKGYRLNRYYEEYNETIKDILASAGLFRQNGKDVTNIFMEHPDKWCEANSTYQKTIPLTQLAIAAFSNYGFQNYVNDDNYGLVTSTITCNDGTKMKTNDFLYGMVCNPFYAEDKFDEIMQGEKNIRLKSLSEFITPVYYSNEGKRPLSDEFKKNAIRIYSSVLSEFLSKKTIQFLQKDTHTIEEVKQIIDNYNDVLEMVTKNYNIGYNPIQMQDILNNLEKYSSLQKRKDEGSTGYTTTITPSHINKATRQILREERGVLGGLVSEVTEMLEKSKGENNKGERN